MIGSPRVGGSFSARVQSGDFVVGLVSTLRSHERDCGAHHFGAEERDGLTCPQSAEIRRDGEVWPASDPVAARADANHDFYGRSLDRGGRPTKSAHSITFPTESSGRSPCLRLLATCLRTSKT